MARLNLLTTASLGLAALTSLTGAQCTREKLLAVTDVYAAAQTAGKLDDLAKLFAASNFTYMENNRALDIKTSVVLGTALKIDNKKSTADTVACASYTELVARGPKPYVLATQIRHNPADMSVVMVDTIAATTGALFFNAATTLGYFQQEVWTPLEPAARPSREVLQKAIDAYLDAFGGPNSATASNDLPWGSPCERVEGSMYVKNCTQGMPKGGSKNTKVNSMRRYVIDEVMGSADVLCSFSSVGTIPDSHEVRIENGKIRYVHTVTLCAIDDGPNWGPVCQSPGRAKTTTTAMEFKA